MFPPLWDYADEQRAENGLDLKISDFGISDLGVSDSRFQILDFSWQIFGRSGTYQVGLSRENQQSKNRQHEIFHPKSHPH
jgi:hypothetical protein